MNNQKLEVSNFEINIDSIFVSNEIIQKKNINNLETKCF